MPTSGTLGDNLTKTGREFDTDGQPRKKSVGHMCVVEESSVELAFDLLRYIHLIELSVQKQRQASVKLV